MAWLRALRARGDGVGGRYVINIIIRRSATEGISGAHNARIKNKKENIIIIISSPRRAAIDDIIAIIIIIISWRRISSIAVGARARCWRRRGLCVTAASIMVRVSYRGGGAARRTRLLAWRGARRIVA